MLGRSWYAPACPSSSSRQQQIWLVSMSTCWQTYWVLPVLGNWPNKRYFWWYLPSGMSRLPARLPRCAPGFRASLILPHFSKMISRQRVRMVLMEKMSLLHEQEGHFRLTLFSYRLHTSQKIVTVAKLVGKQPHAGLKGWVDSGDKCLKD